MVTLDCFTPFRSTLQCSWHSTDVFYMSRWIKRGRWTKSRGFHLGSCLSVRLLWGLLHSSQPVDSWGQTCTWDSNLSLGTNLTLTVIHWGNREQTSWLPWQPGSRDLSRDKNGVINDSRLFKKHWFSLQGLIFWSKEICYERKEIKKQAGCCFSGRGDTATGTILPESSEYVHPHPVMRLYKDHRKGPNPSITSHRWLRLKTENCLREKGRKNLSFFWPCCMVYRISVPRLGIEPGPCQWKYWILTTGPQGNARIYLNRSALSVLVLWDRVFKMGQRTSGSSGSILYYLLFGGCFLAPFPLKRASTFTITARNIPQ